VQSNREYGTQMKREDLLMDDRGDVVRASRRYFTAAQLLELKRQKTQVLQCFWRGYLARRRTWGIRQRLYDAQVAEERGADEAGRAASRRRQFEVERRINPRSAKDFELLYNELEAWRAKEMERVRAIPDATPGDVKAAMSDVLAKETKALQTIDRLKAQAAKEGKARRVERVMELMALPKKWEAGDGELQEVHTPFTTRAQELRDLYRGLATDRLPPDERLQILLNVKWTVQEFACPCVEIKSSIRLQRASNRTVWTRLFGCSSRTRREQSIRPKISRIDFDLIEIERFEVFAGQGVPLVDFHTGVPAHARHRRALRPRGGPPQPRPQREVARGPAQAHGDPLPAVHRDPRLQPGVDALPQGAHAPPDERDARAHGRVGKRPRTGDKGACG
jgi:hypothetical protein